MPNYPASKDTFANETAITPVVYTKQNALYDTTEAIQDELGYTGDAASDSGSVKSKLANQQEIGAHSREVVAASATLTLPHTRTVVVTGTTTVTTITATGDDTGRFVILEVLGVCQFTDGGNIDIEGNFTGPGRLGILCDGTNWKELARSNPSAIVADGSITLAKLATDSVNAAKIVDDSITAVKINSAVKDGPAANPTLRSLGTSSVQAAAGNHTHAGVTGIDIQDEGTALGNIATMNFVGAGVTATFAGGVGTVTIPGSSLPQYATVMKFGVD